MLKESVNNQLEYQRLSQDEMQKRGILGRLVGVCADFFSPTRNGRKYPEELWENVFNDPIMKERIENGVCYGELGHPADREETDMEKIALCLAEVPKKGKDGKLRAVFDILNTPNGRILKSLCDYGSTIGISSRGSGDLETDFDGNESVNPDTYSCEGFDAVLIPAVKEARLEYVTESLNKKRYNKTLRDKLTESINKEDESNQKIMRESLSTLGINLNESVSEYKGTHKDIDIYFLPNENKYSVDTLTEGVQKFNSLKNAISYIDMINRTKLTEEQVGREETRPSENASDVLDTGKENTEEISIEDEKDSDILEEQAEEDTLDRESEPERQSWDTDFYRLYKAYDNYKDFKDIDIESAEIRDLIDPLEDRNIDYDIYKHKSDNGCTVFFNEGLTQDLDEALSDLQESLNGTEALAVDRVLSTYKEYDSLEDCVLDAINLYNNGNAEPEYSDEDFADEEADYNKVLKTVKNKLDMKVESVAAEDDGALIEQLQNIIKQNKSLEQKITEIQEKLSVSYAKEMKLTEQIECYKQKVSKLSEKTKEIKVLNEKLSKAQHINKQSKLEAEDNITKLNESIKSKDDKYEELVKTNTSLKESIGQKDSTITSLKEEIRKLKLDSKSKLRKVEELEESLSTTQKDLDQFKEQYSKKLQKQNTVIEKYQRVAKNSVKKYIESQAVRLGVKSEEITNRLPKSYSFKDIDLICEDLQEYKFNMSNLPFNTTMINENLKVSAKNVNENNQLISSDDLLTDYDLKLAEALL